MAASGKSGNVIAKYLPVYFVLLAIAAIEFFLSLFLSLIPATIFVLLMMNMIWSDSIRLLHMRPFAH